MLPLLSAGASLLGSIFSSSTSASNTQAQLQAQEQMQAQTEQFNAGEAQKNRDFQAQQSNTAYQRATQDMEKAGLNPMMMFGSGSAASTPSGATASVGTPNVPMPTRTSPLAHLGDTVSKALDAQVLQQTFQKLVEETSNLTATRAKIIADTAVSRSEVPRVEASTDVLHQEAGKIAQEKAIKAPAESEAQGVMDLGQGVVQGAGKAKYIAGAAGDVLAPIVSSATRLGGLEILREAFRSRGNANAVRRGMDMERTFGRNNAEE